MESDPGIQWRVRRAGATPGPMSAPKVGGVLAKGTELLNGDRPWEFNGGSAGPVRRCAGLAQKVGGVRPKGTELLTGEFNDGSAGPVHPWAGPAPKMGACAPRSRRS